MTPSKPLADRRALVTGASRGIGRAIALGLAAAGAHVTLAARDRDRLDEAVQQISADGGAADAEAMDVTDEDAVARALQRIETFGPIDVLVNNAGGGESRGFLETSSHDWRSTLALDLQSVATLCRLVGGGMVARGRGAIINIASTAGLRPPAMMSAYAAAKAGVVALTASLAREWGPSGVRVNAVCPGWVRTELTRVWWQDPQIHEQLTGAVPMGRFASPEEIVGPVVFLASNAASYVTGVALAADGGLTGH